jgi:hypothetical protein
MTHDPIAAFFADASRQWRRTLERDAIENSEELEMLWQLYLHDLSLDRIGTTNKSKDGP